MSQTLDCKQLKCPMPIVKISQGIQRISAGGLLAVEASDPAFRADLEAWARTTGHKIRSFREEGVVQYAEIEKADK